MLHRACGLYRLRGIEQNHVSSDFRFLPLLHCKFSPGEQWNGEKLGPSSSSSSSFLDVFQLDHVFRGDTSTLHSKPDFDTENPSQRRKRIEKERETAFALTNMFW